MGNNWRIYSLGELIDVKHGFAFKGEYMRDDIKHGPIVVAIGNFDYSGGFRFSETKLKRYTSDYPEEFILQADDMLLAMTCQTSGGEILGIPGIIPNDGHVYLHNQRLGKVVVKEPKLVCLEYLYWIFLSQDFNQFIFQRATGTKILHTSPTKILEYQTHLPPLVEQKKIARQLWQLQNKSILNRQINQTLEQMAQALFKSWFVDFDPVIDNALDAGFFELDLAFPDELLRRAEARRAVREHSDVKPLPEATRQLFPAAFEECAEPSLGLGGWVPKGWGIHAISDIAFINKESWTKNNAPENIKYVDLSNAKDGMILDIQEFSFEEAPSRARRILKKRDTIFGMVRPANRSFAYVDRDGLTGSTGFVVISAKNKNASSFVYQKLTSDSVLDDLIRVADGAAYPAIKPDDISELMMAVPRKCILDLFEKTIDGYRERVAHNLENNEQLANLRDTLLPKLISGELRLDNIDADLTKVEVAQSGGQHSHCCAALAPSPKHK